MLAKPYRYLITKTARQDLERLSKPVRNRIGKKLKYFMESGEPLNFGQKLTNHKDGDYRFRVGNYRIIFILEAKTIYIVRVQHRREIYRK